MFKYFVFAQLVALAFSRSPEELEGNWTAVKVYPELPVRVEQDSFTVQLLEGRAKCGPETEAIILDIKGEVIPAIALTKDTDRVKAVSKALTKSCHINHQVTPHSVFRPVSDNYVLVFVGDGSESGTLTALVAKQLPTESELKELEDSIEWLKNKPGTLLAAAGAEPQKPEKNDEAPHWLNYFKSAGEQKAQQ